MGHSSASNVPDPPIVAAVSDYTSKPLAVFAKVGGHNSLSMLDSCATANMISEKYVAMINKTHEIQPSTKQFVAYNDNKFPTLGMIELQVRFGKWHANETFFVAPDTRIQVLLGMPFIERHVRNINFDLGQVTLRHNVSGSFIVGTRSYTPAYIYAVRVAEDTVIKPYTEQRVPVSLYNATSGDDASAPIYAIIEPSCSFEYRTRLLGSRVYAKCDEKLHVTVINTSAFPVTLKKAQRYGTIDTDIASVEFYDPTNPSQMQQPGQMVNAVCEEETLPKRLLCAEDEVKRRVDVLMTRCDASLPDEFKKMLRVRLTRFIRLFAFSDDELGCTNLVTHDINTGDAVPIKQRQYWRNPNVNRTIDGLLGPMLKQGIISPSNSEWSSPVVLVKKKDGKLRFCVDYRKLNSVTVTDCHPLPNIEQSLASMGNALYFTTIDLASGYWQVGLTDDAKRKTAFVCHAGLFEFNRLPFGLKNAPSVFSRLMQIVLAGLHWHCALVYMDDVIVYSPPFTQHLNDVEQVFGKLEAANLKIKPEKCVFAAKEVPFLGHIIGRGGVSTDPAKIKAMVEYPEPKNVDDLRTFVGMANYYNRFVAHYAQISAPLYRLLKKDGGGWRFGREERDSVQELKAALASTPVLVYPDFSLPFRLDTDASGVGIGAVVSQEVEGDDKPIAYFSRSLSAAERNYTVTEQEMLAIIAALKRFRPYLLGAKVRIITDHQPLKYVLTKAGEVQGRVTRWLDHLGEHDCTIEYRKGKDHVVPDALSRAPVDDEDARMAALENEVRICVVDALVNALVDFKDVKICSGKKMEAASEVLRVCSVVDGTAVQDFTASENMAEEQQKDVLLRELHRCITAEEDPSPSAFQDGRWLRLIAELQVLYVDNGVLLRRQAAGRGLMDEYKQVVVPLHLCRRMVGHAHIAAGHMNADRTFRVAAERLWFPNMRSLIKMHVKTCVPCQRQKKPIHAPRAPMQVSNEPSSPFERIALDFVGPLPLSSAANRYALVIQDYYTKWPIVVPMQTMEAESVAAVLLERVVADHGVPQFIHSDQGRSFEAGVIRELCVLLGIVKTRTTPYRPQSDGLVERFNRTLKQIMSILCETNYADWDVKVPHVLFAYRTTVHSSTGFTPFMLLYGREARIPLDLVLGTEAERRLMPKQEFVALVKQRRSEADAFIRDHLPDVREKQRLQHDKTKNFRRFQLGEEVLVRVLGTKPGVNTKFRCQYDGPYIIDQIYSDVIVGIRHKESGKRKTIHYNYLKRLESEELFDSSDVDEQKDDPESPSARAAPMKSSQPSDYATSYGELPTLPAFVSGALTAGAADQRPRRNVRLVDRLVDRMT